MHYITKKNFFFFKLLQIIPKRVTAFTSNWSLIRIRIILTWKNFIRFGSIEIECMSVLAIKWKNLIWFIVNLGSFTLYGSCWYLTCWACESAPETFARRLRARRQASFNLTALRPNFRLWLNDLRHSITNQRNSRPSWED